MAIVDKIDGGTIERLRGIVDFYLLRGITPVARAWPKKPTPPYTPLQAEAMAVFSLASTTMKRITGNIFLAWHINAVGKRESWTDTFRRLIMNYWKKNRSIPAIALDYEVVEEAEKFMIKWEVLRLSLDPEIPEESISVQTDLILKDDILKMHEPIYFTLLDSKGTRLVAPYILFKVETG